MYLIKCKNVFYSIIVVLIFNATAFGIGTNWTHFEEGMRSIELKNYDRALRGFNYYIDLPESERHMFGMAYFGRALVFQSIGNYQQAVEEYRLAIQNDVHPDVKITEKAYLNIGTIYMNSKKYNSAIEEYTRAVENNPNNGLAHYYLGLACLKAGQFERAEKEAEEAKKLGITFTALLDGLAKIKKSKPNNIDKAK